MRRSLELMKISNRRKIASCSTVTPLTVESARSRGVVNERLLGAFGRGPTQVDSASDHQDIRKVIGLVQRYGDGQILIVADVDARGVIAADAGTAAAFD